MPKRRLILQHRFALGDAVMMTALVRDIALTYPGEYEVVVDTHTREVWTHNPYCQILRNKRSTLPETLVKLSYREGVAASKAGQKVHILAWFHRDFAKKTGLQLQPTLPKGDLHLMPEELQPLISGRYWLLMAGGKLDLTCKFWVPERWQEVVDKLADKGIACVQAGANFNEHRHNTLQRCTNAVGKFPDARQFMNLIYHAEGVICPVTAAMHIAAVFDKPCVVINGGRENPAWEGYTNAYNAFGPKCPPVAVEHRFLHNVGQLDCCRKSACWKHRVVALNDRRKWDDPNFRCKLPVLLPHGAVARCMEMISSDTVVEAVMSYASNLHPRRKPIEVPGLTPSDPAPVRELPVEAIRFNTIARPLPEMRSPVTPPRPSMIDHPILGGKVTVFVLCFGDYPALAGKCLGSILATLPVECLDLRVGLNAVCDETRRYVKSLPVTKIYDHPENKKKYPLMRTAFRDPDCPITTPYLVWFDDDTQVVAPTMWSKLTDQIVANHPQGCRLYGNTFIHDLQQYSRAGRSPKAWFEQATWWRGRNLRVHAAGHEAPNGSKCVFVAGWFWALCVNAMRQADIPDVRIKNNGDPCIGEQVHQLGYKIKDIGNKDKSLVWTPTKEKGGRRGPVDPYPWSVF